MTAEKTARSPAKRRSGLTRFIVPHQSFSWLTKGLWMMALATGILVGAIGWLFHYHLFNDLGIARITVHPELVERYLRFTVFNSMMVALSSATYITLIAAYLFHRVSGPIYRIERHMEEVIAGEETSECSLRSTDQLRDFCDTYNRLLHSFDVIEPKPLPDADPSGA